jgi:uroporphyrinogen decarboxylase
MTKKERVIKSLHHEQPDITPYSISMTIPAQKKMAAYYGDSGFSDKLGNHIFCVTRQLKNAQVKPEQILQADEFGVVWDKSVDKDIGIVHEYPVNEKNVETYPFPDPENDDYYSHIPALLKERADSFLEASIGFSLFERAWTLAGMEKVLLSFVDNPAFIETLLDRLTDWLIKCVRKFSAFNDINAIHFGDDWGQQHGLIMGPVCWRKYLKPRLAEIYGEVKKHNKYVSIHSCGDIQEILPDLIEIGLNIFNPFQPEVMDVNKMKELYGGRLTFFGGISLQKTLSFGTPEDVKAEVLDRIEKIGKNGGYIASPCHAITKDVPAENIDMLIKTLQSQ